jgi:hypothetical protein
VHSWGLVQQKMGCSGMMAEPCSLAAITKRD